MLSEQEQQELLIEAHRVNYRLRSTFFYRKLVEYDTYGFPETIRRLIPISKEYAWEKYKLWGISKNASEEIKRTGLSLIQVFAHPRLLREHPTLTAYYRNVAALSQKSIGYLVDINPLGFENGDSENMDESSALVLSKLFNEHISLIIENAVHGFNNKHITGLLFASTGAQIDGSWRNAVGDEAEKVVQKMLIKETVDSSQVTAFLLRNNDGAVEKFSKENTSELLDRIEDFRGFTLKNKRSVLFSSEPDISLIDQDGTTIGVIEVKGGIDPAGALERYGAAKKSFEESIRQNPNVVTILVASCITREVKSRVESDRSIKKFFNLSALLTIENERRWFLDYVLKTLLKCSL